MANICQYCNTSSKNRSEPHGPDPRPNLRDHLETRPNNNNLVYWGAGTSLATSKLCYNDNNI